MMPRNEAGDGGRVFAREVVRLTREAWLPRPSTHGGLNPKATLEPKRLSSPATPACPTVPRRRPWMSIAVAFALIVAVVAGELWAVHAASAIDSSAARRIVGDVNVTLSRVAEASLIGPVD